MTVLLQKKQIEVRPVISSFKFSELLTKSDEELKMNTYRRILLDDSKLVRDNFDFISKLISLGYIGFVSDDYYILKSIEESLTDKKHIRLKLLDDFENKDRSYIVAPSFEKASLEVPLTYAFWLDTDRDLAVFDRLCNKTLYPSSTTGLSPIKKSDFLRIKEEIHKIHEKCIGLDDIEKTIIVSDILQDRVQYVPESNAVTTSLGTYITEPKNVTVDCYTVGNIANVLFKNFGVCRGIAATTIALLNNPLMNVNIRPVIGTNHAWNIVKINGKKYYVDNTWSITRNNDRYDESLKAKSFTSDFLLFGKKAGELMGRHIPVEYVHWQVEEDSYDRNEIDQKVKKLGSIAKLNNYNPPVIHSYIDNE